MGVSLLGAKGTSRHHMDTGSLGDSEICRAAQWGPFAPAGLCLAALGRSISVWGCEAPVLVQCASLKEARTKPLSCHPLSQHCHSSERCRFHQAPVQAVGGFPSFPLHQHLCSLLFSKGSPSEPGPHQHFGLGTCGSEPREPAARWHISTIRLFNLCFFRL